MKGMSYIVATMLLSGMLAGADSRRVAIEWRDGRPQGEVSVTNGSLAAMNVAQGKGAVSGTSRFSAAADGRFRLELELSGSEAAYGHVAAIVSVKTTNNPFSFFLRDVRSNHPIYIPEYGVAVTGAEDARSYQQIEDAVRAKGLQTKLERISSEPEESFASAAAHTRELKCQTWLGLSRDMRIFGVGERLDWIQPRFHGNEVALPEAGDKPVRYNFLMGRGWGAVENISRWLEDGSLPILHGRLVDDDITYNVTAFVTLESKPLRAGNVRGTHFLVADGYGLGHMFTQEQQAQYDALLPAEMNQTEETVLYLRISAVNTAAVPRYAFFKNPAPSAAGAYTFEGANGLAVYKSGRVFAVSLLNGKALGEEEVAVEL
jgi:hypothetical protein